jgi:polyphosphate kinase 2
VIKRITELLNPRVVRVVALAAPTEKEKKSWYFQRYVQQLPTAGEIALFDRSWYNRGGVEKVMGFCSDEEHKLFLKHCPVFENMLIEDGFILIKYWFSVSDEEQEKRFVARMSDVKTQWKLSPMDVQARAHWVDYSKAKDEMFAATHTATSPWYVVDSNDKKKARVCKVSSSTFLTSFFSGSAELHFAFADSDSVRRPAVRAGGDARSAAGHGLRAPAQGHQRNPRSGALLNNKKSAFYSNQREHWGRGLKAAELVNVEPHNVHLPVPPIG